MEISAGSRAVLRGLQSWLGKRSRTKEWFWKVATAFCTKETPWNTAHKGFHLPGRRVELTHTDDIRTGPDWSLDISTPPECPPSVQPPQQAVVEHES